MARAYGRSGAESSQRGEGYDAYKWDAKDAKDYLNIDESNMYEDTLNMLNIDPRYKKRKIHNIGDYTRDMRMTGEYASRFRDVAGRRAYKDFQSGAGALSKPWMRKAEGGLIKERTVDMSLAGLEDMGGDKSHNRHSWESRRPGVTEDQARDALRGQITFRGRGIAEGKSFGDQMTSLENSSFPGNAVSPMGTRQLPWSEYMRKQRGATSTYGHFAPAAYSAITDGTTKTQGYLGMGGLTYKRPDFMKRY
jgi:hypothetical protein